MIRVVKMRSGAPTVEGTLIQIECRRLTSQDRCAQSRNCRSALRRFQHSAADTQGARERSLSVWVVSCLHRFEPELGKAIGIFGTLSQIYLRSAICTLGIETLPELRSETVPLPRQIIPAKQRTTSSHVSKVFRSRGAESYIINH